MSDDDEDTVVGSCLHCNAPPPPRSKSSGGSTSYSGGSGQPCPSTSTAMVSSTGTTPSAATRVQVSCDDCRSFICDGCHWCHEFQANHEIRVCDRCDAFYCRGCDEMDQCEDCSEVVCNTCSTLMSCKFCGCGLCEDCATACGRCGIVLCARDAKFAVECDTCRMSYCLVCLASGTKDPCVRCGHRPSKRVEQLVHLRLKSIYKAFKQSGASMGPGGKGGAIKGGDSSAMGGKYSSALRSLTDGNSDSGGGGGKDTFTNFDQSMASEVAAVLQSASNSMANSDGVDGDGRRRGKRASSDGHHMPNSSGGARNNRATNRASNAAAERYFRKTQEEMQAAAAAAESEAEAAAAALLAELDEADKITGGKKKKKKKKKKGKKDAIVEEEDELSEQNPTTTADNVKKSAEDMDDSTSVSQKKKGGKKGSKEGVEAVDEDSSDEEMDFAQLVAGAKGSSGPSKKDKKEEVSEEKEVVPPPPEPPKQPEPTKSDDSKVETTVTATVDFDAELAVLLSNDDEEGLETFLANLKGVPGLGPARKTAKKALKKIRENKNPAPEPVEEPETVVVQTHTKPRSETTAKKPKKESKKKKQSTSLKERAQAAAAEAKARAALDPNPQPVSTAPPPLLAIVSRTNLDSTSNKKGVAECVMQMSPKVVGWVIGKGGSRIKEMMEESGAKIWIDQESMEETQARVVYVSGRRTSVQQAVQRIKEMVLEAPISVTAGADPGDAILSSDAPQNLSVASLTTVPALAVPASTVAHNTPAKKEPTSFAAAAGASTSAPMVTNPGSPTKQQQLPPTAAPQQSWTLPPMVEANVAAPPISSPPPAVAEAPKPLTGIITTVLGCDPRFVALLIGRRGWTVKNIQTESGANLDIDQTVDPPKIIISGQVENVQRAEQMVRDVLKYPHAQLNQEAQQQQAMDNIANQRFPDQRMATNQSPMPMPGLRRDVSHESPGSMNFPPGYAQYQQQQQQQQSPGTMGLFPESAQARISEFLPNDQRPPPAASPRGHQQQQQDWGGHQQNQQVQRNQFSVSLPPFSGSQGQLNSSPRDQQYNSNAPFNNQSPPPHGGNRRPSTYTLPTEQHLHFSPQSHDAAPQAQMQRQQTHQAPGSRNGFMESSTGNSNRTMNGGWDQPSNNGNNTGGGGWSQSQQLTPDVNQLSGYQGQAPPSRSLLSENPFQQMQQNRPPSAPAPSQSTNPGVSDDSIMVDNLFSSIGAAGKGTEGLLTSLGSISLLGGPTPPEPQPMEDWERALRGV